MHLSQEKGKIQSSRYRESPCLVFNRQRHKAEADMLDNDISPEQRKCLETAFEAADKNGDGILSADEYYEIFQTHGLSIGKKKINTIMDKRLLNSFSCFIQERKSRKKCKKGCCCSLCQKGIVDIEFTYPINPQLLITSTKPNNRPPGIPPPQPTTYHTETQNGPLPNNAIKAPKY